MRAVIRKTIGGRLTRANGSAHGLLARYVSGSWASLAHGCGGGPEWQTHRAAENLLPVPRAPDGPDVAILDKLASAQPALAHLRSLGLGANRTPPCKVRS